MVTFADVMALIRDLKTITSLLPARLCRVHIASVLFFFFNLRFRIRIFANNSDF